MCKVDDWIFRGRNLTPIASQSLSESAGTKKKGRSKEKRIFSSQYAWHGRGNKNEIVISATEKIGAKANGECVRHKRTKSTRNDDISIRFPLEKKGTPSGGKMARESSFLIDTMDGKFRDSPSVAKKSIAKTRAKKKKTNRLFSFAECLFR